MQASPLIWVFVSICQLSTFLLCEVLLQLEIIHLEKTHQVDVVYYRKFFYKKVFVFYFITCIFAGISGLHFIGLPLLIAASEVLFLLRKLRGYKKKDSFIFLPFEVSRLHFYFIIVVAWLFVFGADCAFMEFLPFQQGIILKNFLQPLESKVVPLASKVVKLSGEVVRETTLKDVLQAIYLNGIGAGAIAGTLYVGKTLGEFVQVQGSAAVKKGLAVAKDLPNDMIHNGACHGPYFNKAVTNDYLATPKIPTFPQTWSESAVGHYIDNLNQIKFETFKAEYLAKIHQNQKYFSKIDIQAKPLSNVEVINNLIVDDIVREVAREQFFEMLLLHGQLDSIQELIALV